VNGAAKVWATWRTAPFGQKAFPRDQLAGKKGLVTVLLLFVINPRRLSFPQLKTGGRKRRKISFDIRLRNDTVRVR
jgi:hypothetical protein